VLFKAFRELLTEGIKVLKGNLQGIKGFQGSSKVSPRKLAIFKIPKGLFSRDKYPVNTLKLIYRVIDYIS